MDAETTRLTDRLDAAISRLAESRPFAKHRHRTPALDLAARLMARPEGLALLYERAPALDAAGIFGGSDWDNPATLVPQLVSQSLEAENKLTIALETLNLFRMLAVASGTAAHPQLHADHARHYLTQVLALNLRHFFSSAGEATRSADRHGMAGPVLRFVADHIGFDDVLGVLVPEIWRILEQRPLQVARVKDMIAQTAIAVSERGHSGGDRLGAERLIAALFGPTAECREDPGTSVYEERLNHLDESALRREAMAFARAMHDTGLVSDYHAVFLRWINADETLTLVPEALGLGPTGLDSWRRYRGLCRRLIDAAITPATPQAVFGLANLLERGVLHSQPIAPALERQMALQLAPAVAERLGLAFGDMVPPETRLLSGVLELIGQPLGVGQGVNPTCQSARALSMWALNDPDYLMHLIAQCGRFDTVLMHFEGAPINSAQLPDRQTPFIPFDTDPVSVVLVPHLDRLYAEMMRLCAGRSGDPHRWINPEFHGWWVGRDCAVAVDVATGKLAGFDGFVRRFFTSYHPTYNGSQPVIHPQPAGVAVTDGSGRFVGWHAISILRVGEGPQGESRVYFYNPNNDSGQDWGQGVNVSTSGNGEHYGEASLPFEQFTARLYLFHDDPVKSEPATAAVPDELVSRIQDMALASWAADRHPQDPPLAASS